ncbi:hypothetical protein AA313_de0202744 [Arthrobotrys entomopaga]|nr:hypothetical protein AA313_de0202744 [Arthrobotrys entomopaga]
MSFFDLPTEIRLAIYSELLILPEPIKFVADRGRTLPPLMLFRSRRDGLYPAILRTNRKAYGEASPLLYSDNSFWFPEVFDSMPSASMHAHIAPFLTQIGVQARLLRHICIPFPASTYPIVANTDLHPAHTRVIELLRQTCTNIETLELFVPDEHGIYELQHSPSALAIERLNIINTHLRTIRSLKSIIVNLEQYPESEPSDDLTKILKEMGWKYYGYKASQEDLDLLGRTS